MKSDFFDPKIAVRKIIMLNIGDKKSVK